MKKIFTLLSALVFVGTLQAQSYKVLNINQKNGEVQTVKLSDIESLTVTEVESGDTDSEIRVLTFEDADAKFNPFVLNGTTNIATWSNLIDNPQYGGPLIYGDYTTTGYYWYDENNTFLTSSIIDGGPFWNGGHVISNYASTDIAANGDYIQQLTVYGEPGKGGHNGSANFCVHNGYVDASSWKTTLPSIEFKDGVERIIDHMYVTCTTYLAHVYVNGNGFSKAATESDWFKVTATGYDANGTVVGETEFMLCEGTTAKTTWEKWDLSVLGKVQKVTFNLTGTDVGDYGLNTPAYFAYDDVAVRF